jgi:hypothetical protein
LKTGRLQEDTNVALNRDWHFFKQSAKYCTSDLRASCSKGSKASAFLKLDITPSAEVQTKQKSSLSSPEGGFNREGNTCPKSDFTTEILGKAELFSRYLPRVSMLKSDMR